MPASLAAQPFHPNSAPLDAFLGSKPIPPSAQPAIPPPGAHLFPPSSSGTSEQLPPYPLFPPGLILGMVRKMQIDSEVPYSPLSPLDIPTMIPPSTVPPSEILQRVSKFFKEIGEVNPSEGPMNSNSRDEDYDEYDREYERENPVRKGCACIPPSPNLQQVDPNTGTFTDGTVDMKPGSSSSGRLGLGATTNPNENPTPPSTAYHSPTYVAATEPTEPATSPAIPVQPCTNKATWNLATIAPITGNRPPSLCSLSEQLSPFHSDPSQSQPLHSNILPLDPNIVLAKVDVDEEKNRDLAS
ncbi:hypothetical protein RIF29_39535 [Crotalaria pallida]|uniref:SUPPRESSOR-OF-WHITE-APRICOT-like C-terminal domain-containing protein n=1 Tax=Crotalaria pallida TaxID=3830 RepID=A0AAN9HPP6_CROPI